MFDVTVEHPREYFLGIKWDRLLLPRRVETLSNGIHKVGRLTIDVNTGIVKIHSKGQLVLESRQPTNVKVDGYRIKS